MEAFDPYHTWLGIPLEEQPPDHYRLIGVRRFEDNPDVITNGMDRQMQFLRSLQAGKRSAQSQDLLNEISAAAGCLLDRQRKAEYDRQLKQQIAQRERRAESLQPLPQPDFLAPPASAPVLSAPLIQSGKREPQPAMLLPIVVGGAAGVVALVLVVLVGQWLLKENPAPEPVASTATEKKLSPASAVPNVVPRAEAIPQTAIVPPMSVTAAATAPPAAPANPTPPSAATIAQPADDAMFRTFLGRYMYWLDRTKTYPIVNLQVPNKNLWNAEVKANAAGRASEEEISYVGTAKFVAPADGTYLIERDRAARVRIDGQVASDWEMPRTEVELTKGLHAVTMEIGTHGGPYMHECQFWIKSKDTGEEVTFFNTWREIQQFLSIPVKGQPVVEASLWQPTTANKVKLDEALSALAAAGIQNTLRPEDVPERSPGMVGRVLVNGKDAGVLIVHSSRGEMSPSKLGEVLVETGAARVQLMLAGTVSFPTAGTLRVFQSAGRKGPPQVLRVDGEPLSQIGGTASESEETSCPLSAGEHVLNWECEFDGTTMPYLDLYFDPGSGAKLTTSFCTRAQEYAARVVPFRTEIDLSPHGRNAK